MTLSVDALAKQIGLWERIAEFDQRMTAVRGDRAATLLLTLGKLALDEPEIFFPVYARHTAYTGWMLGIAGNRSPGGWGRWVRRTVYAARAFEIFARIERLHPEFLRMDEALFRQAAALARLLCYQPLEIHARARPTPRPRDLRAVLDACTRCRTLFPDSEMAARADELARDCRERYAVLMRN